MNFLKKHSILLFAIVFAISFSSCMKEAKNTQTATYWGSIFLDSDMSYYFKADNNYNLKGPGLTDVKEGDRVLAYFTVDFTKTVPSSVVAYETTFHKIHETLELGNCIATIPSFNDKIDGINPPWITYRGKDESDILTVTTHVKMEEGDPSAKLEFYLDPAFTPTMEKANITLYYKQGVVNQKTNIKQFSRSVRLPQLSEHTKKIVIKMRAMNPFNFSLDMDSTYTIDYNYELKQLFEK